MNISVIATLNQLFILELNFQKYNVVRETPLTALCNPCSVCLITGF